MIARLRGRLDSQGADHLVIDVGGVGYLVHCSTRTLAALPGTGEALELHVETQVRAESITLYGFAEPGERSWFRVLQQVQGVGARVALGVLSVLTPEELARAVVSQDKAALTRASGVGPRLAGRILERAEGSPRRRAGRRRAAGPGPGGRRRSTAPPAAPSRPWSISAMAAARRTPRSPKPPPASASRPRSRR